MLRCRLCVVVMIRRHPKAARTDTRVPYAERFLSTRSAAAPVSGGADADIADLHPEQQRPERRSRTRRPGVRRPAIRRGVARDRKSTRLTPVTNAQLV